MPFDISSYRHVEVSGDAMFPVIKGLSMKALSKVILRKHGFEQIEKGEYYSLEKYLGMLSDLEERMPTVLKQMGTHICSEAIFPEMITFEKILMMTDQAYLMNHRGYKEGEIGSYRFEKLSDTEFLMHITNPYPCIFNEGLFLGYASYFKIQVSVEHNDDRCKNKGDSECNYRIRVL